ncbi:MAG: TonB-dependent receptor [Oxalobacteraceae bacterium]|nr:TonB-dependent receptor [Oxalobacteraceae bacterium]
MISSRPILLRLLALSAIATRAAADDVRSLPEVEVSASRYSLIGVADSASEGVAGQFQIGNRVVARTGELLEVVPGLIVSQHSGDGKANQYFLRGFNLDHGIDFKMSLDGMPINQRSHAHGQGWADLNPLIPELISSIHYRKGPYYAADGDFANAGSANIYYADKIDRGLASFGLGQNGFYRTLLSDAPKFKVGNMLYALELSHYDGPWDNPDNYNKLNGLLRYAQGGQANGFNLTAMAYSGRWNSTDQIPWNEYKQGLISRWGAMDKSSGAWAHRYSLSGEWRSADADSSTLVQAYVINNYLDLYSNFEYGANSQFNQRDSRVTSGINASRTLNMSGLGKEAANTLGVQIQHDQIQNGLFSSRQRTRIACQIGDPSDPSVTEQCRRDRIGQSSIGVYAENHVHWNDWFRTVAGVRGDYFRFANTSLETSLTGVNNTATVNDFIASPKINLVFGPWQKTEYYYSAGNGYHSNDARGVTIGSGIRANGLVRTFGQEVGVRTEFIDGLQTTLAIFQLDNASEIVYIGDAGRTEDSGRRSRRTGFEFNNYFKANRWLTIDADYALARARFRDPADEGNYIPGAVEGVASIAAIVDDGGTYSGSLQLRHFGPRPLTGDNSLRSNSTTTLNGKLGYRVSNDTRIEFIGFNLLNSKQSAIDYAVDSYTPPGSTTPLPDGTYRVFHPIEPLNFRVMLITRY